MMNHGIIEVETIWKDNQKDFEYGVAEAIDYCKKIVGSGCIYDPQVNQLKWWFTTSRMNTNC